MRKPETTSPKSSMCKNLHMPSKNLYSIFPVKPPGLQPTALRLQSCRWLTQLSLKQRDSHVHIQIQAVTCKKKKRSTSKGHHENPSLGFSELLALLVSEQNVHEYKTQIRCTITAPGSKSTPSNTKVRWEHRDNSEQAGTSDMDKDQHSLPCK